MRKLLVSVLAVFLCFACVEQPLNVCKAGGGRGYELSVLSADELLNLRNDIDARLTATDEKAAVYDVDGNYPYSSPIATFDSKVVVRTKEG